MHRNPGIEKRIKREKERRSSEILDAARKVIVNKNFTSATMDDIAAEAGITKPTIYQYFHTKDQLFVSIVEPLIETLATKLEAVRLDIEKGEYSSGLDILRDVFNVYYSTFEADPDLFRLFNIFLQVGLVYKLNEDAAQVIRRWGRKCFREGNLIVSHSIKEEFFRDCGDVQYTTDFVWGTFWGIVQVEQNKWGRGGISTYLKPVLEHAETLLKTALVIK